MNNYTAVCAKVRAMYGKRLLQKDFDSMLSFKSVGDVCRYLKSQTSYSDVFSGVSERNIHRGELEGCIYKELVNEFIKIYNFVDAPAKKILDFRFKRQEVNYLKHHLRNLYVKEQNEEPASSVNDFNDFFIRQTEIDTLLLREAKTFDDFIYACRNTAYKNFLIRVKAINSDYFSIAMGLDSMYFSDYMKVIEELPKKEKDAYELLIGNEADMLNILWIYRSKKYFSFSDELIFTNLLPTSFKLSENDIKKLVNSEGPDKMIDFVKETYYKGLFRKYDDGFYPDENYRRDMCKTAKEIFRKYPETLASISSYLYLKEMEILNITRLTEGIRYGINPELIKQHIRI